MLRCYIFSCTALLAGMMNCHAAPSVQWFKSFGVEAAANNNGGPLVAANSDIAYAGLWNGSETVLNKFDVDGNLLWSRPLTLISGQISVDHLDNAYLSWSTQGDWVVQKYTPSGDVQWTRTLGTPKSDSPGGTVIDALGNVYIRGATAGSLAAVNQGSWDSALAKYDSAGNLLWTRQWGTSDIEVLGTMAVDGLGNVIVGEPRTPIESPGNLPSETSLRKLSASGDLLWTRPFAGWGTVLSVDHLGYSLVHVRPPRAATNDSDISKLSPDGDVLWTRQVDSFWGMADAHGNLYVTRWPTGELDKYGPDGEFLWTLPLTNGAPGNITSIDVDDVGNIFVSGRTLGPQGVAGPVLDVWLARIADPIPEPATGATIVVAAAGMFILRRRHGSVAPSRR
jgi:hypothetical protein